jgi:ATP-dependent 26S proteasome regulatory subunit
VVRSQGRKIIFSTNLPNVGDLDDALIRPGRCFARIHVRNLSAAEARALAEEMGSSGFVADEGRRHSLAEIYRALR